MLKRVYWSVRRGEVITAGVGFRADEDAVYERSVERWELESEWVYKGSQSPQRQQQLESHPEIQALLQ